MKKLQIGNKINNSKELFFWSDGITLASWNKKKAGFFPFLEQDRIYGILIDNYACEIIIWLQNAVVLLAFPQLGQVV